jgi:hypothetical protein
MNLTNTWMNDPTFLAQSAHFFGAIAVLMTASHIFGKEVALIIAGVFVVLALIKEFWYDLNYELPKQTVGDSALDFTFYMVGVVVACCFIIFIKPKL